MEELFTFQFRGIPDYVFIVSFLVLSVLIVLAFFVCKDKRATMRGVFMMLLLEYIFLMLCSTVIFRTSQPEIVRLELMPFWNYKEVLSFKDMMDLWEVLLNMILYMPIGFLLASIFKNQKFRKTLFVGATLSAAVEALQFALHRGLCETDDVIHNTLGCMVGYGLYILLIKGINYAKVRNIE